MRTPEEIVSALEQASEAIREAPDYLGDSYHNRDEMRMIDQALLALGYFQGRLLGLPKHSSGRLVSISDLYGHDDVEIRRSTSRKIPSGEKRDSGQETLHSCPQFTASAKMPQGFFERRSAMVQLWYLERSLRDRERKLCEARGLAAMASDEIIELKVRINSLRAAMNSKPNN